MCFWNFIVLVDRQQQIDHLLGYTINHVHKIPKAHKYYNQYLSKACIIFFLLKAKLAPQLINLYYN